MAFQLSRKLGRRLAERVIAEEITDEEQKKGIFAKVQDAVDSGSLRQQLVAVALLRLTPVVPFRYFFASTLLKNKSENRPYSFESHSGDEVTSHIFR